MGEMRATLARSVLYDGFGRTPPTSFTTQIEPMLTSSKASRTRRTVPGTTRRARGDRRTRTRLRELCDEVLASYRLAQGQDLVTSEDRDVAAQLLRSLTPGVAR
jgi:hypothetical protein